MVIDTSALMAILNDEMERSHFIEMIALAPATLLSSASYVEAGIILSARYGTKGLQNLRFFAAVAGIEIVSLDSEQAEVAIDAYSAFGKGNHPAGLNYGDCFSYALAVTRGDSLLFKGDDFSRTDVISALHG